MGAHAEMGQVLYPHSSQECQHIFNIQLDRFTWAFISSLFMYKSFYLQTWQKYQY